MQGKILQTHFTRDRGPDAKSPVVEPGIFVGVVINNLLPNNLVQVRLQGVERDVNCIWAAGIISGLLGFKTSYIPTAKTKVVVYYTGKDVSYIVGSMPTTMTDPADYGRSLLDPEGAAFSDSEVYKQRRKGATRMMASHKPPIDLAEGEIAIDNLMGVGIEFLRHMSALKAGDQARIETHLMDDMVRVISGTFRHHSALGDHKIYNDGGRLNMEFNGAMYDFEAYGSLNNQQPRAKLDAPDKPNLGQDSQIDGVNDDGRWRLSQYVGWLGDFVNMWVTDPVQALGRLAADQIRSGKFRCHVNSDGSCLVQSVSEICLEKVVRVPVPIRKRREDDPTGNRSDSAAKNTQVLQNWKPSGNIFEMAFQLREYSRWLSNTWSMARFRQMDLDFKVPTESETPKPNPNSYQEDKYAENHDAQNQNVAAWSEVYSCIRIMRDGSLMMVDGYGNSITTTQSGVMISSASDIYLEAAGSINMVAGRDINLLAQKNVGITAVKEAIRLKAKTSIQALVEAGKFIVDFVAAGWLVVKNGGVNVNGGVSLSSTGKVDAAAQITGLQIAAALTNGPFGQDTHTHMFHIFSGSPSPEPLGNAEFQFQSDYSAGTMYQTYTQSVLDRNEQASAGSWLLSGNAVAGKGSPWPGANPNFKVATGGSDMNKPATGTQSNTPIALIPVAMKLKTK